MRLVVVLVVMLMLAGTGCGSSSSSRDVVPPTTGTATTSTTLPMTTSTPPTTAAPDTTEVLPAVPGWTTVEDLPRSGAGAYVSASLVTDGRSLLAVCQPAADGGTKAIWWSDDLRDWQVAVLPGGGCVEQIVASPFGYFAVGPGILGVLRSNDGVSWEEDTTFSGEGFARAHAVFPSPDGQSVTVLSLTASMNESSVAHLFTTADGLTWTEEERSAAELFDSSVLTQVVSGGEGLLAIGQSPGGEFVPTAAFFTSADGVTWRRLTPFDASFNDQVVLDIEVLPNGGYLAVGGDFFRTGLMSSWTSVDGLSWSALPQPPNPAIDPSVSQETAHDVTTTERGFLAAGTEYDARRDEGNAAQSAFWESTDGETWTRLRFDGPVPITPLNLGDSDSLRLAAWPPRGTQEQGDLRLFVQP